MFQIMFLTLTFVLISGLFSCNKPLLTSSVSNPKENQKNFTPKPKTIRNLSKKSGVSSYSFSFADNKYNIPIRPVYTSEDLFKNLPQLDDSLTVTDLFEKYLVKSFKDTGNFYKSVGDENGHQNTMLTDHRSDGYNYDFTAGAYEIELMGRRQEGDEVEDFMERHPQCKAKQEKRPEEEAMRYLLFRYSYSGNYQSDDGMPVLAGEVESFKNVKEKTITLAGAFRVEFYAKDYIWISFGKPKKGDPYTYTDLVVLDEDNVPKSGILSIISDGNKHKAVNKDYDLSALTTSEKEELQILEIFNMNTILKT